MTTPQTLFSPMNSDAQEQAPDTTPKKQPLSQSEEEENTGPSQGPVKLAQLQCTPTKRKRESGEARGHDATVKKSPSVHCQSTVFRPGTAKSHMGEGSSKDRATDHVKKRLDFSQGEIKKEDDAVCSNYYNEDVIKKEEEEEPIGPNEPLIELEIPDHISQPEVVPVERNDLHKMVAFGVETTSLDWDCDIIQLECSDVVHGREDFSIYIKSKKNVFFRATEVNGLTNDDCILKQNGNPVQTVSLEEGLLQLIQHLQENTILISHNAKCFQAYRLLVNVLLEKEVLLEQLREKVVGFSDSYRIYLDLFPTEAERNSYKLWDLIDRFSKGFTNGAFRKPNIGKDNVMKIRNLAELLRLHNLLDEKRIEILYKHSLTIDSAVEQVYHCNMKRRNRMTFEDMVKKRFLTNNMAQKMASYGVTMQDLRRVYAAKGSDGLFEWLNPTITKDLKVINKIWLYFIQPS